MGGGGEGGGRLVVVVVVVVVVVAVAVAAAVMGVGVGGVIFCRGISCSFRVGDWVFRTFCSIWTLAFSIWRVFEDFSVLRVSLSELRGYLVFLLLRRSFGAIISPAFWTNQTLKP